MVEKASYPKLKTRVERERKEQRRNSFLNPMELVMGEFLRLFHDPEVFFTDGQRQVSQLYVDHAKVLSAVSVGFLVMPFT